MALIKCPECGRKLDYFHGDDGEKGWRKCGWICPKCGYFRLVSRWLMMHLR